MFEDVRAEARLHPLAERGARLRVGRVDEVHARLVERDGIERGEDAHVRHLRRVRVRVAVAVDREVVHHADVHRAVAHVVHDGARRLGHRLDEVLLRRQVAPDSARVVGLPGRVDARLAGRGGDADGEVLQRAAEAAHHVALEVVEDHEAVVVRERGADEVLPEVRRTGGARDFELVELVHDHDLRNGIEAVVLDGLPVLRRLLARAAVGGVALDNVALERPHERPDELRLEVVRVAGLAGRDLHRDLPALERTSERPVGLLETRGGDVVGEVDRRGRGGGGRGRAVHRGEVRRFVGGSALRQSAERQRGEGEKGVEPGFHRVVFLSVGRGVGWLRRARTKERTSASAPTVGKSTPAAVIAARCFGVTAV